MKTLVAAGAVALAVVAVVAVACGSSAQRVDPSASASCTCASGEKFDGEACVEGAGFVAPAGCTDDGKAVCGCDSQDYDSRCDATAAGVQVAFSGACNPPAPRGLGW